MDSGTTCGSTRNQTSERAFTARARAARLTAIAPSTCGVGAPAGTALVRPFSGQPVLCYSATITHHYWKTSHSTDGQGRSTTSRTKTREVVSTEVSDAARLAVWDGTGAADVSLRGARVDQPGSLHDRMQAPAAGPSVSIGPLKIGGRRSWIGYQHVELASSPLRCCA